MIFFFFLTDTPPTEIYTLSLHDALPISQNKQATSVRVSKPARSAVSHSRKFFDNRFVYAVISQRSEEHTSELQSRQYLVCRLLLEKKKTSTHTDSTASSSPPRRSITPRR